MISANFVADAEITFPSDEPGSVEVRWRISRSDFRLILALNETATIRGIDFFRLLRQQAGNPLFSADDRAGFAGMADRFCALAHVKR